MTKLIFVVVSHAHRNVSRFIVVYTYMNVKITLIRSKHGRRSFVIVFLGRLLRLLQEIMGERENKTMVFVETKKRADDLAYRLRRAG